MADEYIRKQDAVRVSLDFAVEYLGGAFDEGLQKGLKNNLESLEPADVAPVVHARWEKKKDSCLFYCSECGLPSMHKWPYCEQCGAKMVE